MLNLKLEVDLKLSQAEKARFASEKEQADKNAFYSELERAEQTAIDKSKHEKLDGAQNKSPEQQIGGNLHKSRKQVSNEEEIDSSNKAPEQRTGGNLHNSPNYKSKADIAEHTEKAPEQLVGGNLHNRHSYKSKADIAEHTEKAPEHYIGGNLHNSAIKDGDVNLDASIDSKLNDKSLEPEQSIGGNLERQKETNSSLIDNPVENTSLKEKEANMSHMTSEVVTEFFDGKSPEQKIGGNLHTAKDGHAITTSDASRNQPIVKGLGPLVSKQAHEDVKSRLQSDKLSNPTNGQQSGENLNEGNISSSGLVNATYESQPVTKTTSEALLAQIQASNSQKAEVKQHLAPVSKALKDVLLNYQNTEETLQVKSDTKLDTISPPSLGDKESSSATKSQTTGKNNHNLLSQTSDARKPNIDTSTQLPSEVVSNKDNALIKSVNESAKASANTIKLNNETISEKNREANKEVSTQLDTDNLNNLKDKHAVLPANSNISSPSFSTIEPEKLNSEKNNVSKSKSSSEKFTISTEAKISSSLDDVGKKENTDAALEKSIFLSNKHDVNQEKLSQQIKLLPKTDKIALQQSLQQVVESGDLDEVQLELAEGSLKLLSQTTEFSSSNNNQVKVANNDIVSKNNVINEKAYNSTKVNIDTLSETAKESEKQVKFENNFDSEISAYAFSSKENNESTLAKKSTMSPRAENIFKAITTSSQNLHSQYAQERDALQTVQQFDVALQNAQTQQNTSVAQKANVDTNIAQTFNLQKNDVVKALHDKVNAMLNINNKEAEIRLDPPELGSMQIRIRSEAEQAQVNFVVQNQQAKEALEQSMPKLKEMLAEQGIQLGESNIQQDSGSSSEQGTDEAQELSNSKLAKQESQAQNSQQTSSISSSSKSGIDYYA